MDKLKCVVNLSVMKSIGRKAMGKCAPMFANADS